ncbi:hypothetical protein [Colwellia sp. 20A7]|nr:hypothetical protein [Colwellia sp. 20A7]
MRIFNMHAGFFLCVSFAALSFQLVEKANDDICLNSAVDEDNEQI